MSNELHLFRERVDDLVIKITLLVLERPDRRSANIELAAACEAVAMNVRMLTTPDVVKLLDAEYARSMMCLIEALTQRVVIPKKGDPKGASLIDQALKAPKIPDDPEK